MFSSLTHLNRGVNRISKAFDRSPQNLLRLDSIQMYIFENDKQQQFKMTETNGSQPTVELRFKQGSLPIDVQGRSRKYNVLNTQAFC
jgi:hypothetical protein